jgi:hypothetical protein
MLKNSSPQETIHIVLQRFHLELDWLLSDFLLGRITFGHLVKTNNNIMSTQDQAVDVSIYKQLMEWALTNSDRVKLHAGVIPQPFGRWIKQKGLKPVLAQSKARQYIAPDETGCGNAAHRKVFDEILRGNNYQEMPV